MRFFELNPMPPVRVRLTHSRKKLMRWLKLFDADATGCAEMLDGSASAVTSEVETDSGKCWIVYIDPNTPGELQDDIALLAHEATHVAQFYLADIGEGEPSDELQAYVVQGVVGYIVSEHFKWLNAQPCDEEQQGHRKQAADERPLSCPAGPSEHSRR